MAKLLLVLSVHGRLDSKILYHNVIDGRVNQVIMMIHKHAEHSKVKEMEFKIETFVVIY